MRILFLTHAFNSLAQRLFVELTERGHEVTIELDVNDRVTEEAVALYQPDVVIAPFLKRAIPPSVWHARRCLIVHPGIEGDRGPSALDWAVLDGEARWGVTVLEATGEMDAGPVWASIEFPMRRASKASVYRNEVAEAAVEGVCRALEAIRGGGKGRALDYARPEVRGRLRPAMRQPDRVIDWRRDDTATIVRKVQSADGFPGVRDEIAGLACMLFDAHPEAILRADPGVSPGALIARRDGAVCRATADGAVWITHLKRADGEPPAFKLSAAMVLEGRIDAVPEMALAPHAQVQARTWRDIVYEEEGAVGYLHFPFYNGAMATAHCERLRAAYGYARSRPTRVIVLTGGEDFWSNGIHLNVIEAHEHPAEESWRNINAMNDLVREIVCNETQLTIAAMRGNAGAGGAFLALAADHVYARSGIVLNPHYKGMGNLYGSEYWTYLLPRRVRPQDVHRIVDSRLPIGAEEAARLGMIDAHFGASHAAFMDETRRRASALAAVPDFDARLAARNARRAQDEATKPLAHYREEELEHMKLNFFGFDPSYHVARYNFVAKVPRSRTPPHLALHRRLKASPRGDARADEGAAQALV